VNTDALVVIGVTAACTAAVGLVAALAVRRARRVSLVLALVVAALAPFVALVVSVSANVGAMFISEHDAWVARVALAASAVPAVTLAVVLGRALVADVRVVGAQARALASGGRPAAPAAKVTAELAAVVDELAETRRGLAESRDREQALESARRQVVAFVSHDLRAPLAGVRAAVDGLQDGVLADRGAAYAGISTAVERMTRMLDDLAELSRADVDPEAFAPEHVPVRLADLLHDVVRTLRPVAAARAVALDVDVEEGLEVVGAADGLARVLDNLLGNAVRSSAEGSTVRVVGRGVGGQARIAVDDACGGIRPDDLDHVFELGWQGSPHDVRGREGLGLAIVDRVVAQHGGKVAVEPTSEGCRFEVSLPGASRGPAADPA
jgi:signal transduction histidine kinase